MSTSQPAETSRPDVAAEIRAADNMLRLGDLLHAAEHAAQAIAVDPGLPEVYALVDRVDAAGGGSDRLFPVDGGKAFIGDVAARAHLLARRGEHREALRLIVAAIVSAPDLAWSRAPWWRSIAATGDPHGVAAVLAEYAEPLAHRAPPPIRSALADLAVALARRNETDAELAALLARAALRWGAAQAAELWLRRSLVHQPRSFSALTALKAVGYARTGDATRLIELADMGRETQHWEAVRPALAVACEARPWLNRVPMPQEATATMASTVAQRRAEGSDVTMRRMAVTAVESPSATTAFLRLMPGVELDVQAGARPDPRVPLAAVAHAVWRFDGGVIPVPAAPVPSQDASDLLRSVANEPWPDPLSAFEATAPFAAYPLDELLGLLCHLPPQPDNERWARVGAPQPLYWPRLASAWGCVALLHHRPEEPWATSARRTVLHDLAFGVEDWTTDGALFALVIAAWRDPSARQDVHDTVAARFAHVRKARDTRAVTIAGSVADLMLITPGLTAREQREAAKFRDRLAKLDG